MDQMFSSSCRTWTITSSSTAPSPTASGRRQRTVPAPSDCNSKPSLQGPSFSAPAAIGQTPSASSSGRIGQLASKRSRLNPCSKEAYLRRALSREGELARCGLKYIGWTLLFRPLFYPPLHCSSLSLSSRCDTISLHCSSIPVARPPVCCCRLPTTASPQDSCIKAPLRLQSHTSQRLAREADF
jgi:hypothetical protein